LLSFGSWKEQGMKTLEELQAELTPELLELQRLTGIWPSTIEKRHVKEQVIGRLCYLAEEDLSPLELNTLKRALGMNDTKWRTFKAKFIEGVPLKVWCSGLSDGACITDRHNARWPRKSFSLSGFCKEEGGPSCGICQACAHL